MTQTRHHSRTRIRARWSAIGAAIAVTLGAGGLSIAQAAVSDGERPVTVTIAAERILDTRTDLGLAGPFTDSAPRDLQVTGLVDVASGGQQTVVPPDATAVLVNVTVIRPNRPGFLSLRPGGAAGVPSTSTVNFTEGSIEPNSATVDLNDGKIQIWLAPISDAGLADVAIDVVGYTIDHNHDDRYYTKAEVDDAVSVKADAAEVYTRDEVDDLTMPIFAAVRPDGTEYTLHDSSGYVSSERTEEGRYVVTFDRPVDRCVAVGSDIVFSGTRDVSPDPNSGGDNEVVVVVTDSAGAMEDTYFSLVLHCLPSTATGSLVVADAGAAND